MKRFIAVAGVVGVLALTAGCGSGSSPSPQPTSASASPSSTALQTPAQPGVVDLSHFGPPCSALVHCTLPLQFSNMIAPHESVSKLDDPTRGVVGWPLDGGKVTILCQIKGSTLNDDNRTLTDLWYGIMVPPNEVNQHPAHTPPLEQFRDPSAYGVIKMVTAGYVSALWVHYANGANPGIGMPACTSGGLKANNN